MKLCFQTAFNMRTTITPLEAVNRTYGILLFGWAVQICLCTDYRLIQTLRACVPHTPYTLVLKFVPLQVGCVAQPRTRLAGMQATACLNNRIDSPKSAKGRLKTQNWFSDDLYARDFQTTFEVV